MQGSIVEIAVLLLLILYFGLQQYTRAHLRYRLWFVGWLLVGLAYVVWEVPVTPGIKTHVQDALRFDLMLGGTIFFLLSFVTKSTRLWQVVALGTLVGVPALLVMDALQFLKIPAPVLMVAVLAWECYGIRAAYQVLPRGRVRTRLAIYAICAIYAVCMLAYIAVGGRNLSDWALTEVLICTAVLYGGGLSKRTPAVVVGIAGFLLWAAFYVACDILPKGSHALAVMFLFWSLPKYFVGFSMILKTSEDATEEMGQQAREFRELYEDFRMTFESHPHPMWICSLETGALLSVNAATVQEYGFSEPELLGMRLSDLELPNMPAQESGVSSFPRPFDGSVSLEHRQRHGGTRWVNVVERQISFQGQPARLMLARDITERVKLNRELEHRANHDALTGMLNRPAFDERIPKCLARCDRDGRKAAMLTIDVDHFKQINDTYGHQVGDQCLQIVAARLNSRIRQVDSIARTGGEEFGAIVGGMHAASDAMKIADSLLKVFAAPLRLGKLELWVTVSIGVAVYPDDGDDAEILLRRSDEALYRAKRRGRNQAAYAGDADLAIESADGSASFADAVLVDSSLMDVDLA